MSNRALGNFEDRNSLLKSQKSIAFSVTIQSSEKTLTDNDLEKIKFVS